MARIWGTDEDIEILRKCSVCDVTYGCYNPLRRDCTDCKSHLCPLTDIATHGLCQECFVQIMTEPIAQEQVLPLAVAVVREG